MENLKLMSCKNALIVGVFFLAISETHLRTNGIATSNREARNIEVSPPSAHLSLKYFNLTCNVSDIALSTLTQLQLHQRQGANCQNGVHYIACQLCEGAALHNNYEQVRGDNTAQKFTLERSDYKNCSQSTQITLHIFAIVLNALILLNWVKQKYQRSRSSATDRHRLQNPHNPTTALPIDLMEQLLASYLSTSHSQLDDAKSMQRVILGERRKMSQGDSLAVSTPTDNVHRNSNNVKSHRSQRVLNQDSNHHRQQQEELGQQRLYTEALVTEV